MRSFIGLVSFFSPSSAIDGVDSTSGETALTAAASVAQSAAGAAHRDIVAVLLKNGANPDEANAKGFPPFLCAAKVTPHSGLK